MAVQDKVTKIISKVFNLSEDEIDIKADLTEDLGADSMDMLTIIVGVENEFDVAIDTDDIYSLKSPEDIINYIKKVKNK